jgi:phage-related minor tail protein
MHRASAKVPIYMSSASSIGFGSNAIQNAQLGISRGMANLSRDAQAIAQSPTALGGGVDTITDALVDAKQQQLNVEAAAKALSITDQTLGTLLDIKA